MKNYLVISALGEDRVGLVSELARVIMDSNCQIVDSRMTVLGSEFIAVLLVHGNWNTLAKLEVHLTRLEQALGLTITVKRTEGPKPRSDVLPYAVEVIALEQRNVVHNLTQFFASRAINIEEMMSRSYRAPHTATPMFAINLTVGVPAKIHIALLREEFMDFCDELNLDAVMEPVKG